jgi:hypothetical protein
MARHPTRLFGLSQRVQFGYGLNYLVDTENAVIVDVEPTPARTYDEVESTKTMLDRTERRLNLGSSWKRVGNFRGEGLTKLCIA